MVELHPTMGSSSQLVLRGCCVSGSTGSWREHASAQESESRPTIHLTFEQLEASNVPLHGSLAPGVGQGRVHRSVVAPQAVGEADELLHA